MDMPKGLRALKIKDKYVMRDPETIAIITICRKEVCNILRHRLKK